MCNEHSLPELGYPAGDHFKSSDEAQSTYWLRLMFVHERDGDLYLGQAIPRYWLADGKTIGIERAASEFGPLAFTMTSRAAAGELSATVTAPTRNPPKTIYVRFRHPEAKRMQSVTVNGQPHDQFNAEKEWVVLAGDGGGETRNRCTVLTTGRPTTVLHDPHPCRRRRLFPGARGWAFTVCAADSRGRSRRYHQPQTAFAEFPRGGARNPVARQRKTGVSETNHRPESVQHIHYTPLM